MRKFRRIKPKAIISLALVLSLIFNSIPLNILSAYAAEKNENQKTQQVITENQIKVGEKILD